MKYLKKPVVSGVTRFTKSPMSDVEYSRMKVAPTKYTTFNAGEIVPIYYAEILPHDTFSIDLDFIVRQTTLLKPAMGNLTIDVYAYWVSNQTVNDSWKNVQGENTSGFWTAPEVDLAPLYTGTSSLQIPPESIADYYGFPTQDPIQAVHLQQMNDLKFRGYLEIYNNYFRDENYQSPIPYSKLNIYNGFLLEKGSGIIPSREYSNNYQALDIMPSYPADGSFPRGAIQKALFGEGSGEQNNVASSLIGARVTTFSALDRPLKANKFHDPFTSALPAPQKGAEVVFGVGNTANVTLDTSSEATPFASNNPLYLYLKNVGTLTENRSLNVSTTGGNGFVYAGDVGSGNTPDMTTGTARVYGANLQGVADLSNATGISVNDLRTAIATQQVYEQLARGGSRYLEIIRSFFGIETESPFTNMPIELGHIRQTLDMYQVAQTSSTANEETPQGNLTAFGYTTKGGKLFTRTFLEHGYVHVFAVVRQKNLYSTYLAPDNFRKSTLDFYMPQLANIGEQPIMLRTLNPFIADRDDNVLGYQEAWWEYRYEPDQTSGYFRQGLSQTLKGWTYADKYDPSFTHVNSEWLKSNAREVVDNTLAVTSDIASQFFGLFTFTVDKQRPMPVYSVPGLDTI